MKGFRLLQTLDELGFSSLEGWDESLNEWSFLGLTDFACSTCEVFLLITMPSVESLFPGDFRFICPSCCDQKRFFDFPMAQQGLLSDKYRIISEDGVEKYSKESIDSIRTLKLVLGGHGNSVSALAASKKSDESAFSVLKREIRGNEDAPVPKGYRSISWIRFYEAEAIIHAYKSKADYELKSDSMDVVLKCLYFSDESEERRKFKANVQAIRINNQNQRVIGWIRLEEARAVVEANRIEGDVDFSHLKFGNGGKVQFFAEHLEVARKYRSTTRLLRKD